MANETDGRDVARFIARQIGNAGGNFEQAAGGAVD
jgi:hypothetical protein